MSATECHDYDATSGTLTFQPGDWVRTISVRIVDDNLPELNETFFVALMHPTGATIADGQGLATIFCRPE